jgi:hypothetical protein
MSRIKVRQPVVHIPTFTEYKTVVSNMKKYYQALGVEIPFPVSDYWYYYTDRDGWAKLIPFLVIKSNLYRKDRFDCEDYSLKAQTLCAELFGLNTLRYTYGMTPWGAHGFCTFWTGDNFLIFEPNESFWDYLDGNLVFEWKENGYEPEAVLL